MPTAPTPATLTPGEAVAQRTITAYTLTPEQLHKSQALHRTSLVLSLASTLLAFAVLAALILVRFAPKVQRVAECISRKRLVQAAIVVPALLLTLSITQLPLELYAHHIARAYGLSVQGWGGWLADWAQVRIAVPNLRHLCRLGTLRHHPQSAAPLLVLQLALFPAPHGRTGLRRASGHRPVLQPL